MKSFISAIVGISMVGLTVPAHAGVMSFWSGDGGDTLAASVVPGAITVVTPHSLWGDVSDDAGLATGTAKWISYADTGLGGSVAPNTANRFSTAAATVKFTRTFTIGANGSFDLFILSDDTARVEFSGPGIADPLLQAVFPGQLDPCAPGGTGAAIGCVEQDMGKYNLTNLAGGDYTLTVDAYQTNNDVFGPQYAGHYTGVPEPLTLALVGPELIGMGLIVRRRSQT